MNNDGQPDLLVLMAQGDEGIYLFTNHNGRFTEKRLLRFPPVYGSTYFDLVDFNRDGHPDILYTCGDNADLSPVLKEFHGIYLFTNDGAMNFTQAYFFPLHGAYKALAEDYDQDGDLDIAAISFFPDYQRSPEESFVYLENQGKLRFRAASMHRSHPGPLDRDGLRRLGSGRRHRPCSRLIRWLSTRRRHHRFVRTMVKEQPVGGGAGKHDALALPQSVTEPPVRWRMYEGTQSPVIEIPTCKHWLMMKSV